MKILVTLAMCLGVAWLSEARPEAPGGHRFNQRSGYARGGYGGGDQDYEDANYNFMYEVQDAGFGVDFGHQESRRGDAAQGSYHVLLPDGRVQTVDYTADQNGYQPTVNYQGGGGGYGGGGPGMSWRDRTAADSRYRRGGSQGGFGGHQGGLGGSYRGGFNAGHR